ncbi:hypothetical protein F5X68DRAFT_23729 [Plectosphaerella plurivora]|uniref:lipoyl(octanoyl) transferase n=1 Tax=Plectosphaerella plurivora TaxID=936078 RepID=A0A9P8V9M4_9PEZI|nr:hypothetical protein F5X68DRAFT_23729 [Plectosphaerella plurivora]
MRPFSTRACLTTSRRVFETCPRRRWLSTPPPCPPLGLGLEGEAPSTLTHVHLASDQLGGHPSYANAALLQSGLRQLFLSHKSSPGTTPAPSPFVLSFTPPPTYTLGRRQSALNSDQEARLRRPLQVTTEGDRQEQSFTPTVVETDRGGLTTYHGPGQIVLWPILDIHSQHHNQFTVRSYARLLETTTQAVLSRLNISTYLSSADPGIWVTPHHATGAPERKIAALGVHLRRHITGLGVALNIDVAVDGGETINPWSRFVPCGLEGKAVTNIRQELGGSAWDELLRQHADVASLRLHIAERWVEELSRQIGTDAVRHKSIRENDLIPSLAP